jgi:hypothetical protein
MTNEGLVAPADALRIHNHGGRATMDYITAEGGPGNESIFVESDGTVIPGAIVEDKPLQREPR